MEVCIRKASVSIKGTLLMVLTPVGVGQMRFSLPGLVPDARGVLSGRELVARFATLDRMVWFFRLLSAEHGPDELWLGLRIHYARSPLGLREVIVLMPNPSTHAADIVARAARTAGGQCFTGAGKHFVQYRDAHAPFGYDAAEIAREPGDLILYGADETSPYRLEVEIGFDRLLYGLELRRQPGGLTSLVAAGPGTVTWAAARRGLGRHLVEHLHRADVRAQAALCEPERPTAFGAPSPFWLFRIEDLPARLVPMLARTAGLSLYVPVMEHVLVAAGYAHPLHLDACRALFKTDRLVLLAPPPVGAIVLPTPPLVAIADLVPLHLSELGEGIAAQVRPSPPRALELPLRLERMASAESRTVAAWIPWAQAGWLRRLCYALPPSVLRGHRVALLEPAILVLANDELGGLPLGQPLHAVAPGVLAPVGTRLVPRVTPELLADRLGVGQGAYWVFPALDAAPIRVGAGQLEAFERHILSEVRIDAHRAALVRREPAATDQGRPPDVVHDPLGPWPLWGLGD